LNELELEKKELSEYEQLDKQKRAIEYNIYDKEYSRANEQLTQIESQRENERENQHRLYVELRRIQDEISSEEDKHSNVKSTLDRYHH